MTGAAASLVRYHHDERLPHTTGTDVRRVMSTLHARLVARYRLSAVPGRPEELTQAKTGRTISLGYGCKTIRIRKHDGRTWVDHIDIQIHDGWHSEVYDFLDGFLERVAPIPHPMDSFPAVISWNPPPRPPVV